MCLTDQAQAMEWPSGPDSLDELYRWHQFNATKLLANADLKLNFANLLKHKIQIHDSYSGTGTGGVMMHIQYAEMVSHVPSFFSWLRVRVHYRCGELLNLFAYSYCCIFHIPSRPIINRSFMLSQGQLRAMQTELHSAGAAAGVVTATACDIDEHCRRVLNSLYKDFILSLF